MNEVGRGAKVFDHGPVRGRWVPMDGPDDVLALMDTGAEGVVALVRDAAQLRAAGSWQLKSFAPPSPLLRIAAGRGPGRPGG